MQQNFFSQKNSIIAIVIILVVLGGGYYWYSSISNTALSSKGEVQIDKGILNKNVVDFLSVKDKIKLDNKSFTQKELYGQLVDYTEEIPFLPPPGRKNPFVPYVAP